MRRIIHAGLALLALAGCTAKQPEAQTPRDDVPGNAEALTQIEARLRSRGYTIPFPKEEHRCTEHFDIQRVEVIDSAVVMGAVVVKAKALMTSRGNFIPDDWVGMNCYGGPWAAGQTANYIEDFTFQKWSSGWVLQ